MRCLKTKIGLPWLKNVTISTGRFNVFFSSLYLTNSSPGPHSFTSLPNCRRAISVSYTPITRGPEESGRFQSTKARNRHHCTFILVFFWESRRQARLWI